MKIYTIKDIRKLRPCYDPSRFLSENWEGTVLDILDMEEVPAQDRIWVSVRLLPRHIVECFAVDCVFRASSYAAAAATYATYAYAASATSAARHTADVAADAAYAYAYATVATSAARRAADAAADAAANAVSSAAAAARKQERENQIDSLILLIETKD